MLKSKMMVVLYIIIGLVAIIFIAALFTKKDYAISREILIDKPAPSVFGYLKDFKTHQHFNAWLKKDPNIKTKYRGIEGHKGYTLIYEGNKDVGAGEQELMNLLENQQIDIELRFLKPFKSTSRTPFKIEANNDSSTKVSWTMNGTMNYPMNIALWFINMDKFLGKDVQKSLEDLKYNLEKKSKDEVQNDHSPVWE